MSVENTPRPPIEREPPDARDEPTTSATPHDPATPPALLGGAHLALTRPTNPARRLGQRAEAATPTISALALALTSGVAILLAVGHGEISGGAGIGFFLTVVGVLAVVRDWVRGWNASPERRLKRAAHALRSAVDGHGAGAEALTAYHGNEAGTVLACIRIGGLGRPVPGARVLDAGDPDDAALVDAIHHCRRVDGLGLCLADDPMTPLGDPVVGRLAVSARVDDLSYPDLQRRAPTWKAIAARLAAFADPHATWLAALAVHPAATFPEALSALSGLDADGATWRQLHGWLADDGPLAARLASAVAQGDAELLAAVRAAEVTDAALIAEAFEARWAHRPDVELLSAWAEPVPGALALAAARMPDAHARWDLLIAHAVPAVIAAGLVGILRSDPPDAPGLCRAALERPPLRAAAEGGQLPDPTLRPIGTALRLLGRGGGLGDVPLINTWGDVPALAGDVRAALAALHRSVGDEPRGALSLDMPTDHRGALSPAEPQRRTALER